MTSSKDFRVAIVGGGMVGVACAVRLQRAGLQVDLFESASKFGEIGAGVGLGPNALRALKGLGLYDAMIARAVEEPNMEPFQFISEKEGHEMIYELPTSPGDSDVGMAIHRAVFLEAVTSLLDAKRTHFHKRLESISQSETLGRTVSKLHFQDGTTFEADLVLGTDGIWSSTRAAVAGNLAKPVWTNTVAYRALIPSELVKEANLKTNVFRRKPTNILGDNRHLIIFPISGEKIVNVVIFCTDRSKPIGFVELPHQQRVVPAEHQEMIKAFEEPTLSSYVRGNIALVGDAAHGMCPHLGSGVGQGFEDALAICELIIDPRTNLSNVQDVLKAYDEIRRPRANKVLRASAAAGDLYEVDWREGASADELRTRFDSLWGWIWYHDLEKDIASARQGLENRGVWPASVAVQA